MVCMPADFPALISFNASPIYTISSVDMLIFLLASINCAEFGLRSESVSPKIIQAALFTISSFLTNGAAVCLGLLVTMPQGIFFLVSNKRSSCMFGKNFESVQFFEAYSSKY